VVTSTSGLFASLVRQKKGRGQGFTRDSERYMDF
jgi:hypothetical protein